MFTRDLKLELKTVDEAPNYATMSNPPHALKIDTVIVVKDGMESGQPSFDIQMSDKDGKQYLALVTGNIMNMILTFAKGEFKH